MRAEIEVLKPGLFSTIQDKGRFGFMDSGVPTSGPMDMYASRLGNLLLNNSPDRPVLEITQTGPTLKFWSPANIVITGGNLSPMINDSEIKNGRISILKKGDVLSFGKRILGSRAYVCIQGGFTGNKVLGSYSWYDGLTEHFRLEKGMNLYLDSELQGEINTTSLVKYSENYLSECIVTVYPGPEFYSLPGVMQQEILKRNFTVDSKSNRMAILFKEIFKNYMEPIISGPVIPGTVQLTPSGKMIILMRDCQTTGGYPRVLQISTKGLNVLAQKMTGDKIKFQLVDPIKKEVSPI